MPHVTSNWWRFKPFTQQRSGDHYNAKCRYPNEMSKPYTYGTICKIKAAREMYPYEFLIFHGDTLLAIFGANGLRSEFVLHIAAYCRTTGLLLTVTCLFLIKPIVPL